MTCPVSRELMDPGPQSLIDQVKGTRQGTLSCMSLVFNHRFHLVLGHPYFEPHYPILLQVSVDHVCKAKGKQDSAESETSILLFASSFLGQALPFRWNVV